MSKSLNGEGAPLLEYPKNIQIMYANHEQQSSYLFALGVSALTGWKEFGMLSDKDGKAIHAFCWNDDRSDFLRESFDSFGFTPTNLLLEKYDVYDGGKIETIDLIDLLDRFNDGYMPTFTEMKEAVRDVHVINDFLDLGLPIARPDASIAKLIGDYRYRRR